MNGTLDVSAQVLPQFDFIQTIIYLGVVLISLGVIIGIVWWIVQMSD